MFTLKWGLKGWKKSFWETLPPSPLTSGSGWPGWICHCLFYWLQLRGDPWTLPPRSATNWLLSHEPSQLNPDKQREFDWNRVVHSSRFHCMCTCIPCEAKTQMSSFFLLPNTWAVSPAHWTGTCSSSVQQKPQGGQHDFYGFSLNIWSGHQMQCPKSHRDTLSGRCTTKRKLQVIKMHLWSQLTCMLLKLTIIGKSLLGTCLMIVDKEL